MMSQQNLKNNQNSEFIYKNSIDCLVKTVKSEGLLAMYKGLIPTYLRIGPWTMIVNYKKNSNSFKIHFLIFSLTLLVLFDLRKVPCNNAVTS